MFDLDLEQKLTLAATVSVYILPRGQWEDPFVRIVTGYRRNLPCYCHEDYVKYLCLSSWHGDVPLVNVAGGSLLYPLCVDSVDMIPLNVFL